MKYLQNRNQFLDRKYELDKSSVRNNFSNSSIIKESTMGNDATWGGSLLGRLINSTIRVIGIEYQATRIKGIVRQVEQELGYLVQQAALSKRPKTIEGIETLRFRFIYEKIYEIVNDDNMPDKEKVKELIENNRSSYDNTDGLIGQILEEIEKVSEGSLPEKEDLIEKFENFRDELEENSANFSNKDKQTPEPPDENSEDDVDNDITADEDEFINSTEATLSALLKVSAEWDKVKIANWEGAKNEPRAELKINDIVNTKEGRVKITTLKPNGVEYQKMDDKGNLNPQKITKSKEDFNKIKESLHYSEYLSINENVMLNEKEDIIIWKKLEQIYIQSKIKENSSKIQEIIDLDEDDENKGKENAERKKSFGQYLLKYTQSSEYEYKGKKGWEGLILEDVNQNSNTQDESIAKLLSILTKSLRVFSSEPKNNFTKGDIDTFLNKIGDLGDKIDNFNKEYNELLEQGKELSEKASQNKPQGQSQGQKKEGKEKKNERHSIKKSFSEFKKFRLFEDEETEDEQSSEETDESQDSQVTDEEKVTVKSIYSKYFSEEDYKKYKPSEEKAKELQGELEEATDKPYQINENDDAVRDHIIRIINLFGKAYKRYATEVIPSGRPEGRVSQKTYRQYIYIGDDTTPPKWSYDDGPGEGPWAAKKVFEKWEDGIMNILEDIKMRKVLANARFLPKGVEALGSGTTAQSGSRSEDGSSEKIVRAGRSLLDFMNALVSGDGSFRKQKKKILKEYFGGADDIDEKTKDALKLYDKKIKLKKSGKEGEYSFTQAAYFSRKSENFKFSDLGVDGKGLYEFFKITYKDNQEEIYTMHGQICGIRRGKLAIKFSYRKGKKVIDDMIHSYTKKMDPMNLEGITQKTQGDVKNYIGYIDKDTFFKKNQEIKITYGEITDNNKPESVTQTLKIKPTEGIYFLGESFSTGDWSPLKIKTDVVSTKGEFLRRDFTNQINIDKLLS